MAAAMAEPMLAGDAMDMDIDIDLGDFDEAAAQEVSLMSCAKIETF